MAGVVMVLGALLPTLAYRHTCTCTYVRVRSAQAGHAQCNDYGYDDAEIIGGMMIVEMHDLNFSGSDRDLRSQWMYSLRVMSPLSI